MRPICTRLETPFQRELLAPFVAGSRWSDYELGAAQFVSTGSTGSIVLWGTSLRCSWTHDLGDPRSIRPCLPFVDFYEELIKRATNYSRSEISDSINTSK